MAKKKRDEENRQEINIQGGVHAGRDVIMGDQYNRIIQKVENKPVPTEFAAALRQVQDELAIIKSQSGLTAAQVRNLEFAEEKVLEAGQKASLPEPPVDDIKADLIEAKETIDLISGSIASAMGLGALLGHLIGMVGRVFGLF